MSLPMSVSSPDCKNLRHFAVFREALNIHNHFRQPAVGGLLHAQTVIGDRLDLVAEEVPRRVERLAPGSAVQAAVMHADLEAPEQQMFAVEAVQQLLQPVE